MFGAITPAFRLPLILTVIHGFSCKEAAGILGDVRDRDVLEVGSGAGQCSRWVRSRGGRGVGLDLSHRQLQHSRRLDEVTGLPVPSVRATATALPFRDGSFDAVFSAFGIGFSDVGHSFEMTLPAATDAGLAAARAALLQQAERGTRDADRKARRAEKKNKAAAKPAEAAAPAAEPAPQPAA